jgi:phosphoribosyl 1,2-cyclic phosphate phosphodiesterase
MSNASPLLRVTILGCGSSGGVPRVGSGWGACDPENPKNRRRRCSLLVESMTEKGITRVLIDTSPDLRAQLLDQNVASLDAVLITHEHADHTHGIDDLRPLVISQRKRIPFYMDEVTSAVLRPRFRYCFETPALSDYPPILEEKRLTNGQDVVIEGAGGQLIFTPFELQHGAINALGFRFHNTAHSFAYVPDVNSIPEKSLAFFKDLDVLILDALRYAPHPTHFHLAQSLEVIHTYTPHRAVLTNLHVDMDYETLTREMPNGVTPAYDGMVIE